MTPRRPAPARPGARRTSRPGPARDTRGAAGGHAKTTAAERGAHSGASSAEDRAASAEPDSASERRLSGIGGAEGLSLPMRLLILAVVLVLAFVVVFPSLRGYLTQRAQYDTVLEQIDEARASSTALEEELARWEDDDYVKAQARERLSYVMPGETTYVVVGADSFEDDAETGAPQSHAEDRLPWYQELRESARVAGQVEEEEREDPGRQGWSTPTPQAPATQQGSAPESSTAPAVPSTDTGDEQ
ncbi:septum formation initiator family protein [Actinomyces procaprae]|uniref:FtsB family cell division protein n=1 Tax=Actinomyces procaprae TaxID=2560010 RepID=UPI0031ED0624